MASIYNSYQLFTNNHNFIRQALQTAAFKAFIRLVMINFKANRRFLTSPLLWKQRLMFLGGAVIVGIVAAIFALICEKSQDVFKYIISYSYYAPIIITPLGFMVSAYLTRRFFSGAQSSGIPQVIAAREFKEPEQRKKLVSTKIAIGKIILTAFGLMIGASIGREGPTVQIGAAIMLATGAFFGRSRQHGLVLAGGAAGIAAAFNTPLAGIVFAIEELSRSFERRTNSLVLTAIIFAGISSIAITGNYTYFGTSNAILKNDDWLAVIACGIFCGAMGAIFARIIIAAFTGKLPFDSTFKKYPIIFAGGCGLGVAILGLASGGIVFETGYTAARHLIEGQEGTPWFFGIAKMFATIFSSISGIVGGFFAPALSTGAGFGANLAPLFPHTSLGTLAILGMVAYFSGIVQAPITAFVIVFEMTNDHTMVVPIMAAALIGSTISKLICPHPIYHTLASVFIKKVNSET